MFNLQRKIIQLKKPLSILICLSISYTVTAQSCLPEGIVFTKQSQIDSFQIYYPGCTEISGNIEIFGDSSLTNLTGLNILTSIGGYLEIGGYYGPFNINLTSLAGLENLTSIGGGFGICENETFTDLSGLENLTYIGGSVYIGPTYALTSLTGLESLTNINGDLSIISGFALNTISGLESLSTLGGDLEIGSTTLTSLTGLEGLNSIGGNLEIKWNDSLLNLNGLNSISNIGGDLEIAGNENLTSLFGLDSLTTLGGGLGISKNNQLMDCTGLENLVSIGDIIYIYENDNLISLAGIENINAESVTNLRIFENNSLSNCEVQSICDYLASPNGAIDIYNNATGCNNPPQIAIACGIDLFCLPYGNYNFNTQSDIDNFQTDYPDCTELEGNVTIMGIDITNLYGLNSINSINGALQFYYNDSLLNLAGLDSLTHIGNSLAIWRNSMLANCTGIDNLASIGGTIFIKENDNLISLNGLDNIEANSIQALFITDNPSLSICEVQSICDYLANPNGDLLINNNALGCDSPNEVEEACEVRIEDNSSKASYINIYPNPTSNKITIEATNPLNIIELTILNLNGQKLDYFHINGPKKVIDISPLPNGVYFVKLTNSNTVRMFKVIKY